MPKANDDIITVALQTWLSASEYRPVACNHFEVLLTDPEIDQAREFLVETSAESSSQACRTQISRVIFREKTPQRPIEQF
jgi:hypothetical protein